MLALARLARSFAVLALTALLVEACGGGGGSGSVSVAGLLPPEQISVVTPIDGSALPPAAPDFAVDSDYARDVARVHVYDPAIEPLSLVNMILCLVSQTGADQLVNEPAYLAQVNHSQCETGEDEGSSGTGQASGAVDQFELWTVSSTRASSDAPQSVHYWVPEEDDGQALTIFIDMLVTRGVELEFPFGEFSLDFAGAPDVTGLDTPVFGGALSAGLLPSGQSAFGLFFRKGDVTQAQIPGEHAEETGATVVARADLQGGIACVRRRSRESPGGGDSGLQADEYRIVYDDTHFLRALNGGAPEAFHRDQFVENVWRYNLYHASGPEAGERVELESGFGFRTAAGDYGWIGYWGLWTPPGVEVASGDTITRDEFGHAGASYTVFQAPGKLIRNTRHTLALDQLDGRTFQWWSFDPQNGSTNYVVTYDELAGEWQKIGTQPPGSGSVTPIEPPVVLDTAALGFLDLWSESLGGPTAFVHGEEFVTYYAQQFVEGSDPVFAGGDLSLFGLVQCLRPDVTAAEAEAGDVFLADVSDVASARPFVFRHDDLTLCLDSTGQGGGLEPVGLALGEAPASGPFTWGMRSGPLVSSTDGLTNVWDVWSAPEFYVWETGANEWNHFTRVVDASGDFLAFDPPLAFNYVQANGDDRNGDDSRAGQTYFLGYGGAGQLWGLPQEGVDLNGDGSPDRWYPVVNLADGVLLGPTGSEYVVKGLEIEQTLAPDPAYAGTLDLGAANALTVSGAELYDTPEIGPSPVVTDPPRVVQGVVLGGP
jgi:hypothetical protein